MQARWNSFFSMESGVLPLLLLPTQTKPQGQKAMSSPQKLLWSAAFFPPALWGPRGSRTLRKPCSQGCPVAHNCTQPLQSPSVRALQLSCHGAGRWEHLWEATNLALTHEGEERKKLGLTFCYTPWPEISCYRAGTGIPQSLEEFPFSPRGREGAEHEPDMAQLLFLWGCGSLAHGLGCPAVLLSMTPFPAIATQHWSARLSLHKAHHTSLRHQEHVTETTRLVFISLSIACSIIIFKILTFTHPLSLLWM